MITYIFKSEKIVHLSGPISTKQCWLTLIILLSFIYSLTAFYFSFLTVFPESSAGLNTCDQDSSLVFFRYWLKIMIFPIFWNFTRIPIKNECPQLEFLQSNLQNPLGQNYLENPFLTLFPTFCLYFEIKFLCCCPLSYAFLCL